MHTNTHTHIEDIHKLINTPNLKSIQFCQNIQIQLQAVQQD